MAFIFMPPLNRMPQASRLSNEIGLESLEERMLLMLQGKNKGRTVVRIAK